jgi:hypothetical protein
MKYLHHQAIKIAQEENFLMGERIGLPLSIEIACYNLQIAEKGLCESINKLIF